MVEGFDLLVLYLQDFRERKFNLCLHLTSAKCISVRPLTYGGGVLPHILVKARLLIG